MNTQKKLAHCQSPSIVPAKKKETKKKSGNSRTYGHNFERLIAKDLRVIFDSDDIITELVNARGKDINAITRKSSVQRGQQSSGGAREPDIVTPSAWWFELGIGRTIKIANKYAQGVRDCIRYGIRTGDKSRFKYVAAIAKGRNSHEIHVMVSTRDFLHLMQVDPAYAQKNDTETPIITGYEFFLDLLAYKETWI